MTKEQWRIFYRLFRVTRRESLKVAEDTMLYGSGMLMCPSNGEDPKHVPINTIVLTKEGNP